jgi:hypothetical protein
MTPFSSDVDLQLVILRYVPLLVRIYLSRLVSNIISLHKPLAGFETVLLDLYIGEVKARGGRPLLEHIPYLAQAFLPPSTTPLAIPSNMISVSYILSGSSPPPWRPRTPSNPPRGLPLPGLPSISST